MVWGAITRHGTGRLLRVKGQMNAVQFCDILSQGLLGTISDQKLNKKTLIFAQDNDPKHTSSLAHDWFQQQCIHLLPWLPSSPNLNIIKNVWGEIDYCLCCRKHCPTTIEQLWAALQEEWYALEKTFIENLYSSIPRRIEAVRTARGGFTKY